MYNVRLIFSLILLCSACSADHTALYRNIHALDNKMLSTGSYVIIPNQGCEGCISQAEAFVKRNITKNNNTRYIFTRIQSTKLLKIKLGNDIMSNPKVLLDTANIIEYPEKKNEIYPMTVILTDGRISNITWQNF